MPLYLSALRINGKFTDTVTYVEKLPDDVAMNPLVQLEYAIALHEIGDNATALPIFTTISQVDTTSDWSIEASDYIKIIQTAQKKE
jgi:hypothetical protein